MAMLPLFLLLFIIMHGIKALEWALLSELNKVNGRLYSSVVYNH